MALTKIPRGLLDTGIADSSDATAITIDSSENVTFAGNILKTGDLTLDVSGDFIFDADGGDIRFLDGGTEWGRIQNGTGSQLILQSKISDEDMLFQGNDGGSNITALTLDMSDAGKATFNAGVVSANDSDTQSIFGRTALGFVTGLSDYAYVGHLDVADAGGYALVQSSAGATFLNAENGQDLSFSIHGTRKMVLDDSGNLGIGTTSPAKPLHIYSADNQPLRIESSDAYAGIELKDNTSNASPPLISGVGDALVFYQHNGTDYAERMRLHTDGNVAINDTGTSGHQFKVTSSTMAARFQGGNGGYTAISWTGNAGTTIGSLTTYDGRLYIGSQNSGGTGSNGEIVVKPGTSSSTGGVGTTLGRTPDVSLEVGGPLKIVNNTGGGISQTHTNMTAANSGKLLINFGSIGTMTTGDTIVFTYAATSWKSWFFKIRWSSTGGMMGELWAGGYNNNSDGYQILNPRYYAAGSGDGSSNSTVEGATLTVTRSGQANTMTLTLNNTHIHPLIEIEYACAGGEGYPNSSKASITVNS